jgi:uncharacterized membrane-anchored protein
MRKYNALKIVVSLYNFFGGLVFFGSVLIGLWGISSTSTYSYFYGTTVLSSITLMISGTIAGISMIATGQFIELMLEMVDNSRKQTHYLMILARGKQKQQR